MVSGIGPAAELDRHNVSVISNLEGVGKNMEDHILIGVYYLVDVTTRTDLQNATIARHFEELYRKLQLVSLPVSMLTTWDGRSCQPDTVTTLLQMFERLGTSILQTGQTSNMSSAAPEAASFRQH